MAETSWYCTSVGIKRNLYHSAKQILSNAAEIIRTWLSETFLENKLNKT